MEKEKCPNCNIDFERAHISDAYAGDILMSVWVEYCPECLYQHDSDIKLSK